jgi:putative hydrolase of the HAD superfamily
VTGIEVVLWDIGQVLYQSPFERFTELENHVGMPEGTLPRGPFVPEGDPEYDRVDSGERDEPEYWRDIETLARETVPGLGLYDALRELGWEGRGRPVVLGLLADIPTRYRQAVLTNDATKFLGEGWKSTWEYADRFEVIIDSLDIGVRKPEVAAYSAAVERLSVPAGSVLFIDDLTVNVEGARKAGLQGFRFDTTDPAASVAELRVLLGV